MGWLSNKNTKVKKTSTPQQHLSPEVVARPVPGIKDNDVRQITMEKAIDLTFWW